MERVLSVYSENTDEMEHFFDDFGGEEKAKEEYPSIYRAVQRSKMLAKADQHEKNGDDMKNEGFTIGAIVMDKNIKSQYSGKENVGVGSGALTCDSMGTVNEATMITVNSEMIDLSTSSILDTSSRYKHGTDLQANLRQDVSEIGNYNDHKIEVKSRFFYVKKDGTCGVKTVKTANHTTTSGDSLIQEILIEKPAIKKENETTNKHVNIVYDRVPKNNEKSDIYYDDKQIEIQGELVKTLIPVKGTIKLSNYMEPIGLTSVVGLSLIYKEKTVVLYTYANLSELEGYFSYKKDQETGCYTVQFEFDEDWRSYIHKSWYNNGTYITDCQLRFSFRYSCYLLDEKGAHVKDEQGEEIIEELGIAINSEATKGKQDKYNHAVGSGKVIVPYLYIQWGCFHKDTKILMGDGKEKRISEIEIGELVMTREGTAVPVEQIYSGGEKFLYCIKTEDGRSLQVTQTHPILTELGLIKASGLTVGTTVFLREGTDKVQEISVQNYEDTVFSLDCNGAVLFADGIAAGDFICQNQEKEGEEQEPEYTDEVKEIMAEFKRFSDEFNEKHQKLHDAMA